MDGDGFLEKQAATKGTVNFIISVFCLKKKCWGLQPLLQATLKKNIIDTFSRGSFLLMGGNFFRQKGDIFATKASHLLFQADQGWLLIDFYRTMSSFTTQAQARSSRFLSSGKVAQKNICILGFGLPCVPWSKVATVYRMVISSFVRNPSQEYLNPCSWVDYHPRIYGNSGSLNPGTCG